MSLRPFDGFSIRKLGRDTDKAYRVFFANFAKIGSSSAHGLHQGAQKFTTVTISSDVRAMLVVLQVMEGYGGVA